MAKVMQENVFGATPNHLAVIMDGNGRWARLRGVPRQAGHRAGIKPLRALIEYCAKEGVNFLTLFVFSSENWKRPSGEVRGLMSLFMESLNKEVAELAENDIQLNFIGKTDLLNSALQETIRAAEVRTRNNQGMKLTLAVAYGGRADLVNAAKRLAKKVSTGSLTSDQIDEKVFVEELMMGQLPDVDLLIRTGEEHRISNFLLWSLAYSELYFLDVLWPDFKIEELKKAFDSYASRQRRFGRTAEQVEASNC